MNYEQLIEELREEMLQLVNTKCDALLQMYRSGEVHTSVKDTIRESSLITVSPAELKGKRLLAVQFAPGEWIETPTSVSYTHLPLAVLPSNITASSSKVGRSFHELTRPQVMQIANRFSSKVCSR